MLKLANAIFRPRQPCCPHHPSEKFNLLRNMLKELMEKLLISKWRSWRREWIFAALASFVPTERQVEHLQISWNADVLNGKTARKVWEPAVKLDFMQNSYLIIQFSLSLACSLPSLKQQRWRKVCRKLKLTYFSATLAYIAMPAMRVQRKLGRALQAFTSDDHTAASFQRHNTH